jgi:hypothetical protein
VTSLPFPGRSGSPPTDGCGVEAFGVVRTALAEMPALRKDPGPLPDRPGLASPLRTADDQTIAALAAVLRAAASPALRGRALADWGVVGAPRFPGRLTAGAAIFRFSHRGALGMSPLIIPTLSLHSMAGTLSLLLGLRGPHFGVGGGPGHVGEGLLAALALHEEGAAPGVWLALTECDPEPAPDDLGKPQAPADVIAVALALTPAAAALQLRLRPAAAPAATAPSVCELAAFLEGRSAPGAAARWVCPLPGGGAVELTDHAAGAVRPLAG